jgi:predicted transcriptional regulator
MNDMTVEKLSISLDSRLVRDVRQEAEASGRSVSAVIAAALERQSTLANARKAIAAYEAEFGAFTEEERAETRAEMRAIWGD